jgi:hypothetical protein
MMSDELKAGSPSSFTLPKQHTLMRAKKSAVYGARAFRSSLLASLLVPVSLCADARARCGGVAQAAESRMSVLLTAMGKDKSFVTTLKPEDARLTVDGTPREILELKRQSPAKGTTS